MLASVRRHHTAEDRRIRVFSTAEARDDTAPHLAHLRVRADGLQAQPQKHNPEVAAGVRARALADKAVLAAQVAAPDSLDLAEQALAIAREIGDPALVARALTACGAIAAFNAAVARPILAEASELARALDDRWMLSQILGWQATVAWIAGEPIAALVAGEEGRDLADAIGDRPVSRRCRWCLGLAHLFHGELAGAVAHFRDVVTEADADHDALWRDVHLGTLGWALAYQGDTTAAGPTAHAAVEAAADLGGYV